MSSTQNQHISRLNIRGAMIDSAGLVDRRKIPKTKSDGRFHPSVLDIYPLLKTLGTNGTYFSPVKELVPANLSAAPVNIAIANLVEDNDGECLRLTGHAAAQQIKVSTSFQLPALFKSWDGNAIKIEFQTSDQSLAYGDVSLVVPDGVIATKTFSEMTKVVTGPGNLSVVTVTFLASDITTGSGVAGITYGAEQGGQEIVTLQYTLTIDTDAYIKFYNNSSRFYYLDFGAQSDADDNWPAGQCGTCDICDTCDIEACGLCDSCDATDGCLSCDVCEGGDL